MMLIKSFFQRIIKDFRHKELLPLKMIFFVQASTLYVLYPYLTIHMRELGINVEETAIMSAITPVVAMVMPPLAGMFADRVGNFKILLSLFSSFGGVASLLLLLVPIGRITVEFPDRVVMDLGCTGNNGLFYTMSQNHPCETSLQSKISTRIESCGIDISLMGATVVMLKLLNWSLNFLEICQEIVNVSQPRNHSYKSKLKILKATEEDRETKRQRYLSEEIAWTGKEFQKITCGNPDLETERIALTLPLFNYTLSSQPYKTLNAEDCSKRCIVTAPRREMCSNTKTVIEYNVSLTFWLYFVIRVFISVIGGTTFAMFEGAVIAILREQKADYGLQRIYGSIGGMISSPLSGLLIDYASAGKGYTDFRPAFCLYAALKLMSGLLMLAINLEFKSPATNVISDVFTVLRNIEAAALFIACFILGTAWGYIESFLFWLIQDLGGSRSLMGITITVGGIAGIPLLVLSGPIISKIGHANVLFIGFVFYAIRLCGYSLIYNPWHTLIFEALESVTLSLSFTAAVTYAAKLSTTTTDSSIQGLLGGVYYGVGKGAGSLIGGYLMKAFGTRPTYRIFAVITLITGVMYYIFNVAYLKKQPQVEGNDIVKKKPKKVENQNGLESGIIEIGLEEKKQSQNEEKKNEPNNLAGIDNQAFIKEQETGNERTKDIEAINNAKNLDKIEKVPFEDSGKKKFGAKRLKKIQTDERDRAKECSKQNGTTNPGFESDRFRCNVTVERQPEDKK
ncbi:PREDICTED: major facilitator superfamily domain-containing protein 6 [Eufriesea mexicana]|uniref:major facilitator superfamily domain-containing protein 6 n=1 Tax=Eufriesea mexicana TaxID=516756 RepID=UPI00083C1B23|nr:PREDICTED: major facilitator superfamily domain-containing protein 6 [Eufriesea mexicana]